MKNVAKRRFNTEKAAERKNRYIWFLEADTVTI